MALNFPNDPSLGDQFGDWVWGGSSWLQAQTLPGGLPAGSIIQWGGSAAPVNWLLCDGSAVSRADYGSLFAAIGTSYGSGDGSTTFNLPDLRGRVPVGKNGGSFGTLGTTGGSETVALTTGQIPAHNHSFSATTSLDGWHSHEIVGLRIEDGGAGSYLTLQSDGNMVLYSNSAPWSTGGRSNSGSYRQWSIGNPSTSETSSASGNHTHTVSGTTGSTGSGEAHTNLQPYQVVNYIIKTTAAVTPGDSELAPRISELEAVRPVSIGGTGATSLTAGNYLKGNGTSPIGTQSGIPAGDINSGTINADRLPTIPVSKGGTGSTNGTGLVPIVPTSLTGTGGSASVNANGKVTLSGSGQWYLNGVFTNEFTNYKVIMRGFADGDRGFGWRFSQNGVQNSNAFYHWTMFWNGGAGMGTNAAQSASFVGYSLGHRYMGMSMEVYSPKLTGNTHHMIADYSGLNSATSGNERHTVSGTLRDVNYSADGIMGFVSAGSFTGTIQVFGYRD
jgi:microcystin-dependent protein